MNAINKTVKCLCNIYETFCYFNFNFNKNFNFYFTFTIPLKGTANGCIRIYNWPPKKSALASDNPTQLYSEIPAHSTGVVSLRECPLGTSLVSIGDMMQNNYSH